MPDKTDVLDPLQRRLAWGVLLALAANAPFDAYVARDDSWTLSVVVAALLSMVIVVDDHRRRVRRARARAS